jgi:hypothetical protein
MRNVSALRERFLIQATEVNARWLVRFVRRRKIKRERKRKMLTL